MKDDDLMRLAEEADAEQDFARRVRTIEDFRYDEQQEKFWDVTTGTLLGTRSVDGAIPRSLWPTKPDGRSGKLIPYKPTVAINNIDSGLTVEGSTWWPGKPQFIQDVVVTERGAMPVKGAVCFNRYCPPNHEGLAENETPGKWIAHVKKLFPDPVEHNHFFDFAAHMLQRPDEKVNHGIVIAGEYGIGKDTAMAPLRKGVGEWNAAEVDPDKVTSQYNSFIKSVMLVINEVRPHDDDHKASSFYNQLKTITAAPPDMLPMEEKYANMVYVRNLCHVFLTTNDPLRMYIPKGDRRLFVMTSPLPDPKFNNVFPDGYFDDMYAYLEHGGSDSVIKWLLERDVSALNPGAPPPMTMGKKMIIESSLEVRRSFIDDVLEQYSERLYDGKPPEVVFAADLRQFVVANELFDDQAVVIKHLQHKSFHFKMSERGYDLVKNPHGSEWKHGKFRSRMAFVRSDVPRADQVMLVENELMKRPLEMVRF